MKYLAIIFVLLPMGTLTAENIINYDCSYTKTSRKDFNKATSEKHRFALDLDNKKGYLIDANGKYEFIPVWTNGSISIMVQVAPIGNVNSVTIDENLNIVYSRNTMWLGELDASQYYGKCEIVKPS